MIATSRSTVFEREAIRSRFLVTMPVDWPPPIRRTIAGAPSHAPPGRGCVGVGDQSQASTPEETCARNPPERIRVGRNTLTSPIGLREIRPETIYRYDSRNVKTVAPTCHQERLTSIGRRDKPHGVPEIESITAIDAGPVNPFVFIHVSAGST